MTLVHKTLSFLYGPLPKKLLYIVALLVLSALFSFCIFYISSDYSRLQHWFLSLNGSFYKKETWTRDFFTPAVKAQGNSLAGAGIACAALLSGYIVVSWRACNKRKVFVAPEISLGAWGWYAGVFALSISLGVWSWCSLAASYDEIFSAVNCTELHPFQTVSYYMLPNNHMYFNFINNVSFRWLGDTVASGRLMSMVAYAGVLLVSFHWFYRLTNNYFYAFIAILPIALQFTVWGMAAQARGYEAQLFCAWVSFITMFRFALTEDNRMLKLNALFNILGFIMVSTYLLFYVAQAIVLLSVMVYNRRFIWQYYKCQMFVILSVFLLYLPAFCFSGIPAFTDNPYVKPGSPDWIAYMPNFCDVTRFFINFCFSMICGEDRAINFVLFFLPLLLFFSRKKERRLIAFCYLMLWVAYALITVHMRRNPFNRNMIMHYSLTLSFTIITLYVLADKAGQLIGPTRLRRAFVLSMFVLPALAFGTYLAITDKRDVSMNLYYNDVNAIYATHTKEMALISPLSSIGFSYEAFYMYYLFRNRQKNAHRSPQGNEDYMIVRHGEPFPVPNVGDYIKVCTVTEDYEFFKRK